MDEELRRKRVNLHLMRLANEAWDEQKAEHPSAPELSKETVRRLELAYKAGFLAMAKIIQDNNPDRHVNVPRLKTPPEEWAVPPPDHDDPVL